MESEINAAARDLLYLAFVFFGAAAGSMLNRFRLKAKTAFRSVSITLGLLLLSGAVASFAVMFILNGGKLFMGSMYYITGAALSVLALLSLRFPRAFGFPLILAAGIVIVWTANTFVRLPRTGDRTAPLAHISVFTDGSAALELPDGKNEIRINLGPENAGTKLVITGTEYAEFFPLLGGTSRARITEIINTDNGNIVYKYEKSGPIQDNFASREEFTLALPAGIILPERRYGVFYDGFSLAFR